MAEIIEMRPEKRQQHQQFLTLIHVTLNEGFYDSLR